MKELFLFNLVGMGAKRSGHFTASKVILGPKMIIEALHVSWYIDIQEKKETMRHVPFFSDESGDVASVNGMTTFFAGSMKWLH